MNWIVLNSIYSGRGKIYVSDLYEISPTTSKSGRFKLRERNAPFGKYIAKGSLRLCKEIAEAKLAWASIPKESIEDELKPVPQKLKWRWMGHIQKRRF